MGGMQGSPDSSVSELRVLLSEMRTPQHKTSLLVIGCGIGDIEQIVSQVINEQDDNMTRTVVIHCNECDSLRMLRMRLRKASQKGERITPFLLVMFGLNTEAWMNQEVIAWVINHMSYKISVVFVSQSDMIVPPLVLHNMDNIVCFQKYRSTHEAFMNLRMPKLSTCGGIRFQGHHDIILHECAYFPSADHTGLE